VYFLELCSSNGVLFGLVSVSGESSPENRLLGIVF
jgi:hypothetical protein